VPTLDAVASGWLGAQPPSPAPRLVVPCVDGQRGDVFAAAFSCGPSEPFERRTTAFEPHAARPEELGARLAGLDFAGDITIVGDGAVKYRHVIQPYVPDAQITGLETPIAAAAARLAAGRVADAVSPHAIRPIYLRRPDAEVARARGIARGAPPLDLKISLASGAADVSAVEALQRRSFTNAWGAEAIRWELENTDVARLYVAHAPDGSLVGYCACWMIFDELHINSLAIEARWRRRGAARQLLRRVVEDAVQSGARSATLEVRTSNTAARALYERLGFRVEGVRRDYYQEPREDALVLWNRRLFTPSGALW
jgi:ribosomal-protein-alanine N-acetyltransferase